MTHELPPLPNFTGVIHFACNDDKFHFLISIFKRQFHLGDLISWEGKGPNFEALTAKFLIRFNVKSALVAIFMVGTWKNAG